MKKLLSLLLCLALLAGLFAVSAAADDAAGAPAEKDLTGEDFTAAVAPQAFAMTMAAWLSGQEDAEALSDPVFLWDAAGWYAAWLYRTEGVDLLSPEELGDFLRSLGGAEAEMPVGRRTAWCAYCAAWTAASAMISSSTRRRSTRCWAWTRWSPSSRGPGAA